MTSGIVSKQHFFHDIPEFTSPEEIEKRYLRLKKTRDTPLIILDDDPTGIQTVHGIKVYMSWDKSVFNEIFSENAVAFIHTNTRAYPAGKVKKILDEIMANILEVSLEENRSFEIISRSDSTLRGHYPLETGFIRDSIFKKTGEEIDGEIIIPFFKEGGRITANDIHYVIDDNSLIPAGETEFARDPDFHFNHSNLKKYIEEKTNGKFRSVDVISIPLELLRKGSSHEIAELLMKVEKFSKVIVNAVDYRDLQAFVIALYEAKEKGKKFLYRTAASFVKAYAFNGDRKFLTRADFTDNNPKKAPILLIAGSYTGKTSSQLEALKNSHQVQAVEVSVRNLLKNENSLNKEIDEVSIRIDSLLGEGKNAVVFTSRELIKTEDHLKTGEIISQALVKIIETLKTRPAFMIAKGGITSSVLAVDGLRIRKAMVEGQFLPGVPAITSGPESKWPGLPYIIFPGNVGDSDSLTELFDKLV